MKKLGLTVAWLLMWIGSCWGGLMAQSRIDSLALGNCSSKIVSFESVGSSKIGGAALLYTADQMALYRGCIIDAVYVGVPNHKLVKEAQLFVSRSLDGEPDYVQKFVPTRNNWNRVKLDVPYVIDEEQVYIGYVMDNITNIAMTNKRKEGEEWIRKGDEWSKYTQVYSAALCAVVRGENLPRQNVKLMHAVMPEYGEIGKPIPLDIQVENMAVDVINSLDLKYRIGDVAKNVQLEGLDIESMEIADVHVDGIILNEEGDFQFDFELTAVNGQADAYLPDNRSEVVVLPVRKEVLRRKPLLEIFSTELCSACPAAHNYISKQLADRHDVVEIGHHAGFYVDPFTQPESEDYLWFYPLGRLFAPALMWDRSNLVENYPLLFETNSPINGFSKEHFDRMLDISSQRPAYASVNVDVRQGSNERMIAVHVDGEQLLPFAGVSPRLFVMLTEDSIYSKKQAGASQGFYHRHVLRKSLTDTWGMEIDLENGYQADFSAEIPMEWNADKMHVVAFVANSDAKDCNNCQVLNAEWKQLKHILPPQHLQSVHAEEVMALLPGGVLQLSSECAEASLYTSDGILAARVAHSGGAMNVSSLSQGVYLLKVLYRCKPVTLKLCL